MPNDLTQRLLSYADLTPAQQDELDGWIDEHHPELGAVIAELRDRGSSLGAFHLHSGSGLPVELLAYALTACCDPHGAPETLQDLLSEVFARIAGDPRIEAQCELLLARMEQLAAGTDPKALFERLVGRPLEGGGAA